MNFAEREAYGHKIEYDFERFCDSYKLEVIHTAIETRHKVTWNMNMNYADAQNFWDKIDYSKTIIDYKMLFKKWLLKNNNNQTPAWERHGPDRVVICRPEKSNSKYIKCGFSIKSKMKDLHKFYTIEAMELFAHRINEQHYDCKIYYVFPPDNYSPEWRFCSAKDLLRSSEYFEPPDWWKGSRKPCFKVSCKMIYKPLWILFETNFSDYAGSI